MYITLIADKKTRRVLGVEAVGKMGDAVKARVDAVAALLEFGVDVEKICGLETGYAPPYASAMDVINNAGNTLDNILDGYNKNISPVCFLELFHKESTTKVVDVREKSQADPLIEKYGDRWIHIPQGELGARLKEIPADEEIFVLCDTGTRSYEAQIALAAKGLTNTRNIQGGLSLIMVNDPDFI